MKTRNLLIIITIAGLLASLFSIITDRSWASIATFIGFIGALAEIYMGRDSENKLSMKLKSGNDSENYQAARDIKISK